MPQQIPIVFRAHPLPVGFNGTPQEVCNALVARLVAEGTDSIAFFVTGSTEPTSNSGPWLKDGEVWYIWDNVTGSYIPQPLDPASIKIHYGQDEPDPAVYNMWVEYNGSGKSVDIKTYYSGAWHSVFEDKFAQYSTTSQMNTAISNAVNAAVSSINVGKAAFSLKPTVAQSITFLGAGTQSGKIDFGTEVYDPDGVISSSEFIVPESGFYSLAASVQVNVTSGSPGTLDIVTDIISTSLPYPAVSLNNESNDSSSNGRVQSGAGHVYLSVGSVVTVEYTIIVGGACTVTIQIPSTSFSGVRIR